MTRNRDRSESSSGQVCRSRRNASSKGGTAICKDSCLWNGDCNSASNSDCEVGLAARVGTDCGACSQSVKGQQHRQQESCSKHFVQIASQIWSQCPKILSDTSKGMWYGCDGGCDRKDGYLQSIPKRANICGPCATLNPALFVLCGVKSLLMEAGWGFSGLRISARIPDS